ncbi:DUF3501 family protein [Arenibaculum pallidiluteum]|uniref:DUF3501 family protein n=1 Tax=Arenibaculum pallidiluteum TaxID=2812559 RepID=UPI001A97385E|nr:DUF3501 family protein [Arenibaculum pallidiluteum]
MLPPPRKELLRHELLSEADYELVREARLREAEAAARERSLPLGPTIALRFASFASAWVAAHERLRARGRSEAELVAALREANALIPDGPELVAAVLPAEAGDAPDPAAVAAGLALEFAGETVRAGAAVPGIARFALTPGQVERFRQANIQVVVASEAPGCALRVVMPEATRRALSRDLP